MLSEVDRGDHDSSFFPYLKCIDYNGKPVDLFTQGIWGGLPQTKFPTHLMEYLKDPVDTGQTEDEFSNFKSIKKYRASYTLSDPEHLESSY